MVTRCCCCGVGGNGKKSHRKSVPEDRKRLIASKGDGGKKKRPVSGDSNSTFASALSSPHNYEDECDARLEGQRHDEDQRVRGCERRRRRFRLFVQSSCQEGTFKHRSYSF